METARVYLARKLEDCPIPDEDVAVACFRAEVDGKESFAYYNVSPINPLHADLIVYDPRSKKLVLAEELPNIEIVYTNEDD
ncbi:hypothetical protein [Aeropyrum globular virus 1]|uniref:hypothetical protein n=1 Tax=Aeropyrum globular virus 1 TaxID=1932713 RepID=UPI000C7EBB0D|nr:hypothetical protein C1186_gp12 [Aeropyrum globular virus 1]BBC20938.1 hypothetical protein [Aeropyrum globular virus 1]